MIKRPPEESKPDSQPPEAPAPLPIPDVQTHLGILRDLIYSGDRDALAKHVLSHWPAFVGADAQAPCVEHLEGAFMLRGYRMRYDILDWLCDAIWTELALVDGLKAIDNYEPPIPRTLTIWPSADSHQCLEWVPGNRPQKMVPSVTRWLETGGDQRAFEDMLGLLNQISYGLLARDIEANR